jgi:hypothetical protein
MEELDLKTGLLFAILVLLLWHLFIRKEHFTVSERVSILEDRVNALYSGGAGIRNKSIYTGTNQQGALLL